MAVKIEKGGIRKLKNSLTESDIVKYDLQGMCKVYDNWPEIAEKTAELNLDIAEFRDVDHIIFAGMGGSGTVGDMFQTMLSKTDIHISVIKGYHIPKTANQNTLVVASSASGNTAETLSILDSANKNNCKTISFSSGGKMEQYCTKNNLEYRKIPSSHSPRASLPLFLYAMLKTLESLSPVSPNEIKESMNSLKETRKNICSSNLSETNRAIKIAYGISKIPVVYYPSQLRSAAIRFKNSFQENAKAHIITEEVMEMCHNGIMSWETKSNVSPVLIEEEDFIETKKRYRILKEYFESNNVSYMEVFSIKGNILTKLINMIYVLDYSSIYKAISCGINPSSSESISFVKKKINDN